MTRWIHPTRRRYYQAQIVEDLFGQWTLVTCWGGLDDQAGTLRKRVLASQHEGRDALQQIARRRTREGYRAAS